MGVPPLGPYWKERQLSPEVPLSTVRARASMEFDNAPRWNTAQDVAARWETLGPLIPPSYYHLLEDRDRGGPARFPLDVHGKTYLASVSSVEFAAMAARLAPFLKDCESVLEIGGGYGGLADAILRAGVPIKSWTILDIPSTARVSRWYLSDVKPARVLDVRQWKEVVPADVVVQTRGFMEMSLEEVAFYLDRIQDGRFLEPIGIFWTINRLQKRTNFVDYQFDERWSILRNQLWPHSEMIEVALLRVPHDMGDVAQRLGLRD